MNGTQLLATASFGVVPSSYTTTTELGAAINGDSSANTLTGNGCSDTQTGGAGADTFDFNAVADSTLATPDVITDVKHGIDKIDLTDVDANTGTALDPAFLFGDNNAGIVANNVTWVESGGNTILNFDKTGDTTMDMQITLTGLDLGLVAADFFL